MNGIRKRRCVALRSKFEDLTTDEPPKVRRRLNSPTSHGPVTVSMAFEAELLNDPDADDVKKAEYMSDLLAREAECVVYAPNSAYLEYRQYLVEFVYEIQKYCKLGPYTAPATIQYIDRILAVLNIDKHSLYLITACCSLLAAKFLDTEDKIPSINELHDWCLNSYSHDEIRRNEVVVAERLKWKFHTVTPMHFLQFYLTFPDVCHLPAERVGLKELDVNSLDLQKSDTPKKEVSTSKKD
eukprot:737574_1